MMLLSALSGLLLGALHAAGSAGAFVHYGAADMGAVPRFWLFWLLSGTVALCAGADNVTGGLLAAAAFWGGWKAARVTGAAIVEMLGR